MIPSPSLLLPPTPPNRAIPINLNRIPRPRAMHGQTIRRAGLAADVRWRDAGVVVGADAWTGRGGGLVGVGGGGVGVGAMVGVGGLGGRGERCGVGGVFDGVDEGVAGFLGRRGRVVGLWGGRVEG